MIVVGNSQSINDSIGAMGANVLRSHGTVPILLKQSEIDIELRESHLKEGVKVVDHLFIGNGIFLDTCDILLTWRLTDNLVSFGDHLGVWIDLIVTIKSCRLFLFYFLVHSLRLIQNES